VNRPGPGDRVRIREGPFQGMDGEVKEVIEPGGGDYYRLNVEVFIYGRPVTVELDYWQADIV
jgi:transcriptional antiterminator NusG